MDRGADAQDKIVGHRTRRQTTRDDQSTHSFHDHETRSKRTTGNQHLAAETDPGDNRSRYRLDTNNSFRDEPPLTRGTRVPEPGRETLSSLDIVAALTRVVQDQERENDQQRRELESLRAEHAAILERLATLEGRGN
jgi:hypothetical protein